MTLIRRCCCCLQSAPFPHQVAPDASFLEATNGNGHALQTNMATAAQTGDTSKGVNAEEGVMDVEESSKRNGFFSDSSV